MSSRLEGRVTTSTRLRRERRWVRARVLLGVAALALMLAFARSADAGVFAYPVVADDPALGPAAAGRLTARDAQRRDRRARGSLDRRHRRAERLRLRRRLRARAR